MKLRRAVMPGAALPAAVALLVNTVVVGRETRAATPDVGRILDLEGPDVQVREDGRPGGAPILSVHGLVGSIRWWDRVVPALASRYRVIRVDLVGHGGAEKPRSGYDPLSQAEQLGRALDRLSVDGRAVVVSARAL